MGKRKLTHKQSRRIEKTQHKKISQVAVKENNENLQAFSKKPTKEQSGLVIAHYGDQVEVEPANQPEKIYRCHLRSNLPDLVTGDRVVWQPEQNLSGVIVACHPRSNVISRPDGHGKLRPMAANIDQIFIVISPVPAFHEELIDRYLVAAEVTGIEPVIVMNKMDLLSPEKKSLVMTMLASYETLGYTTFNVSANTGQGMQAFKQKLNHASSILAGQSGVGKSSLINQLIPGTNTRVGTLSTANVKGRHTTTTSRLFHLPCEGHLIDSPGIRRFGLWHMTPQQVYSGFRELWPLINQCKFRNCQHSGEPGCALTNAVSEGKITQKRWESCQNIINSL